MVGIGDVDDQQAAEDQHQEEQAEVDRVNIPHPDWKKLNKKVDRRAELLDLAEEVGLRSALVDIQLDDLLFDVGSTDVDVCPGGLRELLVRQAEEVRRLRSEAGQTG